MTTLLNLLEHLPAGARLDSTSDFQAIMRTTVHASNQRVIARIVALGLHTREAELSSDGKTISIYGAVSFFPWPAFTVRPS